MKTCIFSASLNLFIKKAFSSNSKLVNFFLLTLVSSIKKMSLATWPWFNVYFVQEEEAKDKSISAMISKLLSEDFPQIYATEFHSQILRCIGVLRINALYGLATGKSSMRINKMWRNQTNSERVIGVYPSLETMYANRERKITEKTSISDLSSMAWKMIFRIKRKKNHQNVKHVNLFSTYEKWTNTNS